MSIPFFEDKLKSLRENRNRLEDFLNTGNKVDSEFVSKIEDTNTKIFNQAYLRWKSLPWDTLDDDKKKYNQLKEQIDAEINECNRIIRAASRNMTSEGLVNWGKLFSQIGLVLGFLLIWAYCFFQINYFPSGFGIGEISFLVFVSLGFGLLFFVCTFLLWFSAFLLGNFHSSIKKLDTNPNPISNKDKIDISLNFVVCSLIIWFWFLLCQAVLWLNRQQAGSYWLIGCLLLLACIPTLFCFLLVRIKSIKTIWNLVLVVLVVIPIVCYWCKGSLSDLLYPLSSTLIIFAIFGVSWISNKLINYDTYFKIICHFIIVCVVLLIFNSVTSSVFYMTFEALGIKHNQISISLSEDDHKKVKALAKEQNLPLLFSCEDENQTILNHTNVLWNGIGEHILLGIPSLQKNQDVATIEVKKSDSKILRGIQSNEGCTYHKFEKAFESGQAILDTEAKKELFKDMDNLLSQSKISLTDIEISAFSDLTPYKGKGMNNLKLSEERAESVKNEIENKYCKESKNQDWCQQISIESMGNSKPTASCLKTGHDKKDVVNCRADDRSVLIRLKWKVSNKK